jgi:DNA-binding LacI/PurR family transcriptional regulator
VDNDIQPLTRTMLDQLAYRGGGEAVMLATEGQQRYLADPTDAFQRWVAETGRRGRVVLLPADVSPLQCYEEVRSICSGTDVDVLYIAAEILAGPALQAVYQSGRRVPDDLQVVAASDGLYARTAIPPLTCVDVCPDDVGRAAVAIMHEMITTPADPPGSRMVDGKIRWRGSTMPPSNAT